MPVFFWFLIPTNISLRNRKQKREVSNGRFVNLRVEVKTAGTVLLSLQNPAVISLNLKFKMSFRLEMWKSMLVVDNFSIEEIICTDYWLKYFIPKWSSYWFIWEELPPHRPLKQVSSFRHTPNLLYNSSSQHSTTTDR